MMASPLCSMWGSSLHGVFGSTQCEGGKANDIKMHLLLM